MADINVERRGPSIWPWIIGLIVLALLIWALTQMFRGDDTRVAPVAPVDTIPADTPAVPGTGFGPGVGVDTPVGGVGTTPGTPPPP